MARLESSPIEPSLIEHRGPRRGFPLVIASAGAFGLIASTVLGPSTIAYGALAFLVACLIALRDSFQPILTWPNAVAGLFTIIWLIPIKLYTLPVNLPFNLEVYRLLLLLMVFVWVLETTTGHGRVDAAGHRRPLLLLAVGAVATQLVYMRGLDSDLLQTEALKNMTYFLSFLLAFLLITSNVKSVVEVNRLVRVVVLGAAFVGLTALWESRSGVNLFSQLDKWIPLDRELREVYEERGGRLRVYASAQHPIALGVALILVLPLALYLAQTAVTNVRRKLWFGAALVIAAAAMTTISRTTVIMLIVMALVGLRLRSRMLLRYWPLLLLLPLVVHFVAPGALGGIQKAFFPKEGLVGDLTARAGQGGSGRFADVAPGFDLWIESPIVGHGIGSLGSTGAAAKPSAQDTNEIIFDNQYLNTLVSTGLLGIVGAVWFIWGAAIKLGRTARRTVGPQGDLIAACSVSCAGFAAAMLLFDAFSFVQSTLVFFIVAALGLRLRELVRSERDLEVAANPHYSGASR